MADHVTRWLDERGRRCPLPIVALMRAAQATPGTVVAVIADDPAARFDVPAWCRLKGAQFLGEQPVPDGGGGTAYVVRLPADTGSSPVA